MDGTDDSAIRCRWPLESLMDVPTRPITGCAARTTIPSYDSRSHTKATSVLLTIAIRCSVHCLMDAACPRLQGPSARWSANQTGGRRSQGRNRGVHRIRATLHLPTTSCDGPPNANGKRTQRSGACAGRGEDIAGGLQADMQCTRRELGSASPFC